MVLGILLNNDVIGDDIVEVDDDDDEVVREVDVVVDDVFDGFLDVRDFLVGIELRFENVMSGAGNCFGFSFSSLSSLSEFLSFFFLLSAMF